MSDAHDDAPHSSGPDPLFVGIIVLAVIAVLFFGLRTPFEPTFVNGDYFFSGVTDAIAAVYQFFAYSDTWATIKFIITAGCVFLIGFIFWLVIRLIEIEKEHEHHVYPHDHHEVHENFGDKIWNYFSGSGHDSHGVGHGNEDHQSSGHSDPASHAAFHVPPPKAGVAKWNTVVDLITSPSESDWRMAIIEADTLLDQLTKDAGFIGETLGERLKNADPGLFRTLDFAWDAHKLRNQIAHQGSDLVVSRLEFERAVKFYEAVFLEFGYI